MKKSKVFIIAEIGVNHNGNLKEAFKLIDEAKKCGADAVKFQTYITNELVLKKAPKAEHHKKNLNNKISHYDILKKLELKFEDFKKLKRYTKQKKLKFISTPYDIKSLKFLIKLKVDFIKFASSDLINYPMLEIARKSKLPIIISTGMSTLNEVEETINFLLKKNKNITVLKCTSSYPAPINSVNLKNLDSLREIFKNRVNYGFSDHTLGSVAAITSLKYGVKFIEKHFTLNKKSYGPDHNASMEPFELKNYINEIKNSIKADGSSMWKINNEEYKQMKTMRKGCYARYNLKKGDTLKSEDIIYLRPPNGISPKDIFLFLINKKINKDIKKGMSLDKKYFL